MDIVRKPLVFNRKTGIVGSIRLAQILLNLGGVICIGLATCWAFSSPKDFKLWNIITWLLIMILELFLSASGIILYFLAKCCKDDDTFWRFSSGAYYIVQSHIILYALLLGSQGITNDYFLGGLRHSYIYAGISGAVICELSSILHFFSAFFPGPAFGSNFDGTKTLCKNAKKEEDGESPLEDVRSKTLSSGPLSELNSATETLQSDANLPQAPPFS